VLHLRFDQNNFSRSLHDIRGHRIPPRRRRWKHTLVRTLQRCTYLSTDITLVSAPTEVIELENTLNGTIFPQEEILRIAEFARERKIKLHLDGARIWHVAAATGKPLTELLAPFDSASLCFSKGLGAPIGSCLVGSKAFITRARWFRKLFGGGMRQTGILAASAAYALSNNFPKLIDVHKMAMRLEQGLSEIGCRITSPAETCMVSFHTALLNLSRTHLRAGFL
jgi:threonine aldolase